MSKTADFVVIGGGIVGCATACYLAKLGAKNIVLLEKDEFLATGATAKSAAAVRAQFASELNIRLSKRSLDVFETFEEEFGINPAFVQNGYLFVASSDEHFEALKQNVALQNRCGVQARLVSPEEMLALVPQLNVSDSPGGAFCPRDGYIDPNSLTMGFSQTAKKLGVRIEFGQTVTDIAVENEKIKSVSTDKDTWNTPCAINCTGPAFHLIAKLAGVDVPARPYRRMLFTTKPFDKITPKLPLIIDMATGFYCRREAGGVMMGMADKSEKSSTNQQVDWDYLEKIVEVAFHRIPVLEDAEIDKGWAGLYSVTPDHHAIAGEAPNVGGFWLLGGFSGHGIMHSPAAAEALSKKILGLDHDLDISPLALTRFAEGKLLHETAVI